MLNSQNLKFHNDETRNGTNTFEVTGFRDEEHCKEWRDNYHRIRWGYAPRFDRIDTPEGIRLRVAEWTSCD